MNINAVSGIYKITCTLNGKVYIGKTKGKIKDRVMKHLDGKTPGCKALHAAILFHGKDNFTWEILHENVIPELLSDFEKQEIKEHNTVSPNGYNLTWGGETGEHSQETIQRRTETLRASPPMLGKKHSPEAKAKMSETRTGLKYSEEHRRAISEGNIGHEVSKETREKISESNTHPQKGGVHKYYLLLPLQTPYREKIEILSTKFPDIKRKTINYWMYEWESHKSLPQIKEEAYRDFLSLPTSLTLKEKRKNLIDKYSRITHPKTIERWVSKWKSKVPHEAEPYEKGFDVYTSLPNQLTLAEKREILYVKFPCVERQTVNNWTRKWSKTSVSNTRPEYPEVHKYYLFLSANLSIPEKRYLLHEKFPNTPKYAISRWVRKWSNTPASRNAPTHLDYDKVHKFFLSLPSDMSLKEKKRLLGENFPNISPAACLKWIKRWTGTTLPIGAPSHPKRPEIHEYFLSLPSNMPISEKRKNIVEKFGDTVGRSLVNRWIRKWYIELTGSPPPDERWYRVSSSLARKGKPANNRRPEYNEAHDFFFSLPMTMPSREKSKQLLEKYPHIPKGTIYQWTSRWTNRGI